MRKCVLFAMLFVCAGLLVYGQSPEDFEVIQNKDGKTLTIGKYKGTLKAVIIPEKLYDLPVTTIGEGAFAGDELTSVIIPNSVTTIMHLAFNDNKLTSITVGRNARVSTDAGFETSFVAFYESQGWAAGTYVKKGAIWSKVNPAKMFLFLI